jgi:hypothetical protein
MRCFFKTKIKMILCIKMTVVELNELFELAQQHGLPGVDAVSVSAIKRNIASGRFPHQHYIVLFLKRLEVPLLPAADRLVGVAKVPADVTRW